MEQALAGIKILDLTHHVAGPYATRLLAGYGAEVIKIEPPGTGDPTRLWGPFPGDEPHPEKSGFFLVLNTGKKSVTLNLKTKTGVCIFEELARTADAVVENFSPGVMAAWGLGWHELHELNPKLSMVSISNFGQDGPYRDYKANELMAFAMGGMMSTTGDPDREPVKNFGHAAEYMAGLKASSAAMTVIYGATAHGGGQHVDLSIQEEMVASLESSGPIAFNYGYDAVRSGSYSRAAMAIYPCKDGHMMFWCLDRNIPALFRGMGSPELIDDPRFSTAAARQENDDILNALIISWCAERTKKEIYEIGIQEQVPVGYMAMPDELLEWPPLRDKGFWQEVEHPFAGTLSYPGGPSLMSEAPYVVSRAPLLGEHNEEVLCGRLGYTNLQLSQLRALGII